MNSADDSPSEVPSEGPDGAEDCNSSGRFHPTDSYEAEETTLDSKFDAAVLEVSDNKASLGRLGNYDLIKLLGSGGMGVVFEGLDVQLRRVVAVKVLSRRLATSPTAKRRFIREARAAAAINHDNVVTIHAVEEYRNCPFLVMELVKGESLRNAIRRQGRLDHVETLRLAAQISSGLAAAHAQGVIHRDIKPGNILLDRSLHRAKLSDFGLARAAVDNVELTGDGVVVGTPGYMAPEQILGQPLDPRADLFSLGCVIYAMLSGHSPFHGKSYLETSRRVTDHTPLALHEFDPKIPRFLSDLVAKLLQKNPDERPQSAAEVSQLLARHLVQLNQAPSDKISQIFHEQQTEAWNSGRRNIRRRPTIVAILLLTIVAVCLGLLRNANKELTVALDGSGRFASIAAALADVRPASVIRLTTPGDYVGPILLDGSRHDGVAILGVPGAIVTAPIDERSLVDMRNVRNVTLKGFKLMAKETQIGLTLAGRCDGCLVDSLQIEQPPQSAVAAVYLHNGAAGSQEHPIRLQHLQLLCGAVGVVLGEDDTPQDAKAVEWVELTNSRVTGPSLESGVLLILMSKLQHLTISNNLFTTGYSGVSLRFPSPGNAQAVAVQRNTFSNLKNFLYSERTPMDQDVQIRGNAIVHVDRLLHGLSHPGDLPVGIADNIWERDAELPKAESAPIAVQVDEIPFLSRDPSHPDYLQRAPAAFGEIASP